MAFPGGEAKVGCIVPESIYSHKPLRSSICCGSSASAFSLSPASCLSLRESVVRKCSPQEQDHSWALCYAAHILSTCFRILLAFVSVTLIFFFSLNLGSGQWSLRGYCWLLAHTSDGVTHCPPVGLAVTRGNYSFRGLSQPC